MKASTVVAGLLLASAGAPVQAADFYMIDASRDQVVLLDPSSIAASPDGSKTARIAMVHDLDLWTDDKMEFDCPGARYRSVSSVAHLAGGDTLDRSSVPGMVGEWANVTENTLSALVVRTVCQWSPSMMSGDQVYSAPDFDSALHGISSKLTEMGGDQ
jgi:hypothetical protein